ncbi:MAG: hypothetical protein PUB87_01200 [Eubacteriaceae bacterium]|nr:hypothetical protein [Eubacteriaceae bacterium]
MIVKDIASLEGITTVIEGDAMDREISEVYCCDLLSVAMGGAPEGSCWCTVMANMNTLAVAALADCACIVLCCNAKCDDNMLMKAKNEGITVFSTELPVFKAALEVHRAIEG